MLILQIVANGENSGGMHINSEAGEVTFVLLNREELLANFIRLLGRQGYDEALIKANQQISISVPTKGSTMWLRYNKVKFTTQFSLYRRTAPGIAGWWGFQARSVAQSSDFAFPQLHLRSLQASLSPRSRPSCRVGAEIVQTAVILSLHCRRKSLACLLHRYYSL